MPTEFRVGWRAGFGFAFHFISIALAKGKIWLGTSVARHKFQ